MEEINQSFEKITDITKTTTDDSEEIQQKTTHQMQLSEQMIQAASRLIEQKRVEIDYIKI